LKMCKQWGWQVGREEKSKTNISHPWIVKKKLKTKVKYANINN
jgi:hypothetical protein